MKVLNELGPYDEVMYGDGKDIDNKLAKLTRMCDTLRIILIQCRRDTQVKFYK